MALLNSACEPPTGGTALQAVIPRQVANLSHRGTALQADRGRVENPFHRVSFWFRPAFLRLLAFALLLVGAVPLIAQPAYPPLEAGVKAGYLFTFTKYTEWPTNAFTNSTAPIVIGVLGEDPFGTVLDQTLAERISQNRKVVIRRAREVQALRDCQVIFICRSEKARLPAILAALRQAPVLTVCDDDAFFQQGVMIKFALVKETVRFEVRLEPAERAGIKFGSGMLGSAKKVWPKSGGEVK